MRTNGGARRLLPDPRWTRGRWATVAALGALCAAPDAPGADPRGLAVVADAGGEPDAGTSALVSPAACDPPRIVVDIWNDPL